MALFFMGTASTRTFWYWLVSGRSWRLRYLAALLEHLVPAVLVV